MNITPYLGFSPYALSLVGASPLAPVAGAIVDTILNKQGTNTEYPSSDLIRHNPKSMMGNVGRHLLGGYGGLYAARALAGEDDNPVVDLAGMGAGSVLSQVGNDYLYDTQDWYRNTINDLIGNPVMTTQGSEESPVVKEEITKTKQPDGTTVTKQTTQDSTGQKKTQVFKYAPEMRQEVVDKIVNLAKGYTPEQRTIWGQTFNPKWNDVTQDPNKLSKQTDWVLRNLLLAHDKAFGQPQAIPQDETTEVETTPVSSKEINPVYKNKNLYTLYREGVLTDDVQRMLKQRLGINPNTHIRSFNTQELTAMDAIANEYNRQLINSVNRGYDLKTHPVSTMISPVDTVMMGHDNYDLLKRIGFLGNTEIAKTLNAFI